MYTTTWCGICVHTKRYLKSKNVEFDEIDIEEHPEIGDRIEELTGGFRIVPTLEIDGKMMVNPSRKEIDEALAGEHAVSEEGARAFAEQARELVAVDEGDEPTVNRYDLVCRRDPNVLLLHVELSNRIADALEGPAAA